jgi:hypothetical protein
MAHTSLSMLIPLCWFWVTLLVTPSTGAWAAESFLTWVQNFFGLSASTSQLKGPDEEGEAGDIWLVDIVQNTQVQLTRGADYRSPVFAPGDDHIVALKGDALVHLPKTGGEPERLHTIRGVTKIVGFHKDDRDKALILLQEDGETSAGVLSLTSGHVARLPYNRQSEEDQRLIIHMQEWERVYDGTKLYVKGESKPSMGGYTEWTDVFLKRGDTPPQNLSRCDGVNCGQPSLSHNGRQVVYIRAGQR